MEIQNNKISIINDIDYKKLNNDCKAKHSETKKAIEEGLNLLISLRNVNINQIEIELKKSVVLFKLLPIKKLKEYLFLV